MPGLCRLPNRRSIAIPHRKEPPMYARLISFSGADPEKRDSAIEMIRGTVIPMLQNYDGFAGYISLYDADEHRAKAIILWSSRETADAAEETLAERRKQM